MTAAAMEAMDRCAAVCAMAAEERLARYKRRSQRCMIGMAAVVVVQTAVIIWLAVNR